MKKSVLVWLGLLVITNLYWTYEMTIYKKRTENLSKSFVDMSAYTYELDLLREARKYELMINGCKPLLECELFDDCGIKYRLRDILDGDKLILKYTESNCHACVEEQIENLKIYIDSIGISNIAMIVSTDNPIYLSNFRKINDIKFSVYTIRSKKEQYFEDIGLPYFFILSYKGEISNTFIPYKEMPGFTNDYLRFISNRYFLND